MVYEMIPISYKCVVLHPTNKKKMVHSVAKMAERTYLFQTVMLGIHVSFFGGVTPGTKFLTTSKSQFENACLKNVQIVVILVGVTALLTNSGSTTSSYVTNREISLVNS